MNEENNIEQRPEDGKIERPEGNLIENISAPEAIEQTETEIEKPGTITSDLQKMEVHHHPHVEKKNFKEYFLEFLMIFLAVTMGFIAENIREHFADKEREKQYLQSLYVDLKADTAFINLFNYNGIAWEDSLLEMQMSMINSGRYATESKSFYQSAPATTRLLYFQYNNSTYEQLKSSGNLRLLSNHSLAKSLTEYDNFINEVVKKFESRYIETNTRLTAVQCQALDVSFFKKNPASNGVNSISSWLVDTNPSFKGEDIPKLKMLNSLYFEKRSMYPSYRNMMDTAKSMAVRLIEAIKKGENFE